MRFELYDDSGNLLKIAGFMTRSYGSKSGDLIMMRKRFLEWTNIKNDLEKFDKVMNVKDIVCTEAPDYMFDMDSMFEIIPNKFKNKNK